MMGVTVIGGHTEITHGLDRPIINSTLIGEVAPERLVTPAGAQPGDHLLLTKGVPIETTAILAREFPTRLRSVLTAYEIEEARNYFYDPGISVLRDAQIALDSGKVTAMHDPTEGGIANALWELAQASSCSLIVNPDSIPIPALARRVCDYFGINPLASIASGSLLLTAAPESVDKLLSAFQQADILCADIGHVSAGPAEVLSVGSNGQSLMIRPERDEIARLFEE
jgi:hydrogenase maturation factor